MVINKQIVLSFDLDNTLINNRLGIINSFNYALNKFGLPLKKGEEIQKMIGIPLDQMFLKISDKKVSELVLAFRKYYGKKGIYQGHLINGVQDKLSELNRAGFILGIITSKKEEMAIKMTEILNIREYFDFILGETEERKQLGKMDPYYKEFFVNRFPQSNIVIIGDHPKDALLSNNLGCPFIGVLTGNFSARELKEVKRGKVLILNSASEIDENKINGLFN